MRSSRLLPLLVLALSACGDDIKFPEPVPVDLPDPALNGVFPAKAFTDRQLRVEISGDATEFVGTPSVQFGGGITVDSVELASPSSLFATITIPGTATLGKHDVTVMNEGGDQLVLLQAFEVFNPLEIFELGPSLQGGIGQYLIVNHDPEHPFLGDIEVTGGAGTTLFVNTQDEFSLVVLSLNDTDAVTGPLLVEDSLVDTVTSRGGQVTITPRAATVLQPPGKGTGLAGSGTLSAAATTALFSFTTQQALARGESIADDFPFTNDNPVIIWLPGGKWANSRGFSFDDLIPTAEGGTLPLVVINLDLDGLLDLAPNNVDFDVAVTEAFHDLPAGATVAEVEDNDPITSTGTAQVLANDHTLVTGTFADFFDFDVFEVTVAANERIRVTATNGALGIADSEIIVVDSALDAFLDVDASNTNTDGGFFFEDGTTAPLPAGTYQIIFTCSPDVAVDPVNDPYEGAITILPAAT